MVGGTRIELVALSTSKKCSTTELTAHITAHIFLRNRFKSLTFYYVLALLSTKEAASPGKAAATCAGAPLNSGW